MDIRGTHGVELEGYIQIPTKISLSNNGFNHQVGLKILQERVSKRWYYDDGKPEFPSEPKSNLGQLAEHLRDIISKSCEELQKNKQNLIFIGCEPYQTSMSSGHIHSSISKSPSKLEQREMRRILFSVQPFIALLGMNSPFYNGMISDVKSTRLAFGHWSEWTIFNNTDNSHYLSLADGRKTTTLECRIPSSGTIYQILANVAFIKTILNLKKPPPIISNSEKVFYNVIQFGGQALVQISNPLTLSFLGLGNEEIYITINELFKMFLTKGESSDILKEVMMEFNTTDRKKVYEFFNLISDGYTASDYYALLFNSLHEDRKELSNRLSGLVYSSYAKGIGFWNIIDKPVTPFSPILEERITLEELEQIIGNWKSKIDIDKYNKFKQFKNVLFGHPYSIKDNKLTRKLFNYFLTHIAGDINSIVETLEVGKRHISMLKDYEVIKFKDKEILPLPFSSMSSKDLLVRGKNFSIVAQLLKEID